MKLNHQLENENIVNIVYAGGGILSNQTCINEGCVSLMNQNPIKHVLMKGVCH